MSRNSKVQEIKITALTGNYEGDEHPKVVFYRKGRRHFPSRQYRLCSRGVQTFLNSLLYNFPDGVRDVTVGVGGMYVSLNLRSYHTTPVCPRCHQRHTWQH